MKKSDQLPGKIPFVMAGTTNAGVVGYISNPVRQFPANAISVDIFGNTFFRGYSFGAGDDTGVYWNDTISYSPNVMLFLAGAIQKTLTGKFSYGKKLRSSQSYDFIIPLPQKNNAIDFDFMESFIAEMEARRIVELEAQQNAEREAYFSVTGLEDIRLALEEERAIKQIPTLKWNTFNLEVLFGKSTRGKRLKSADRVAGTLPFVTAGEADEGISDYIGNDVQVFAKNTTTVDMFGSAKYRNYDYGADDHIAVVHTEALPAKAAMFVTAAIHKTSHSGQFSYGRNFYAKDADALSISLPVAADGTPDYETMELLISAAQKLVIQDVVDDNAAKMNAAKTVISE